MNFHVTVLKILVSYPDGFAVMADLKRGMAILASGRDWVERTKRLAARVPDLDIFSQALVERLGGGWRITEKGQTVLAFMENRSSAPQTERDAPVEQLSIAEHAPRLLASTRAGRSQRLQRRRAARGRAKASRPPPLFVYTRENLETFRSALRWQRLDGHRRASMVDEVALKNATENAWTVYRARHPDVETHDSRRCLLERHLHRRWEERESDTEELASFGIAYLHQLPRDEC